MTEEMSYIVGLELYIHTNSAASQSTQVSFLSPFSIFLWNIFLRINMYKGGQSVEIKCLAMASVDLKMAVCSLYTEYTQ